MANINKILKEWKEIVLIVLGGILIRIILIPTSGFKIDTDAWFAWALRLNEGGFNNFYSEQVWTNYTPGFLYILSLLGVLKEVLNISDPNFYLILKFPTIISEILLGLLAFKIVEETVNKKWALLISSLILFNPSYIFNSSIWGQIDGILTFFLLISIYYLDKQRLTQSSLAYSLAFLIKPQAIAIAPIFILYLLKNTKRANFWRLFLPGSLVVILLSFPFFQSNPLFGIYSLFLKMVGDYPYNSMFAYNLWGSLGFWINDLTKFLNLSYQYWGYILFSIYWIYLIFLYFKKDISLYTLSALSLMAFYFLPTRVHDRYLYPALTFLFITSALYKSKVILVLSILLTIIHTLNLYYVYIYYNMFHLNLETNFYYQPLYDFLNKDGGLILSVVSTLTFLIISLIIFKLSYVKNK